LTHSDLFDDDRVLFAQFQIGGEAEDFLRTDLGKYLQGVAKQEIENSLLQMLSMDSPCVELHKKAQRARDAMQWIAEAINAGEAAEMQLREKDAHEVL
jgi:hypothetical protein